MQTVLKDILNVMTSAAIILGVIFSYFQIRKISKSIETGQQSNTINVLNCFTKEYDEIMVRALECTTSKKVITWYFRYWNLTTNEFLFFSKGLLDSYIFEFWAFKLCLYYKEKPSGIPYKKVNTYYKSQLRYIENHNGNYPKSDRFFRELMKISDEEKGKTKIRNRVHKLVKKYGKMKCC
ncbi:MAG: hypothetical protein KAI71_03190 [Candidatus Pacebacteria bacterium]|nr:hypothetical protein [Candidatus Paceibacterota bacterium]